MKLRIGIMSTAAISNKLYHAIQSSQKCSAYAIASRSLGQAQKWALDHNVIATYGTYQELLDDNNVDAVYIPLPTSMKKEWTIKAANKGKHVLVDKPLPGVDSVQDLEEMLRTCQLNQVQFMDCTMWLHSLRTKDILRRKQEIGGVKIVNSAVSIFLPPGIKNIRFDPQLEPLGCLGDLGWYSVGCILFAYDYEMPIFVRSLYCLKNSQGAIIQMSGFLQFQNQRIGYFDCGFNLPHRVTLEIVGEQSVIKIDDFHTGQGRSGNLSAYFDNFVGSTQYFIVNQNGKECIQVNPSNHTQRMVDEFADLVANNDSNRVWEQKTLKTQKVLVALFRSQQSGGMDISID